ncbi:MAG: ABC transporter ATP-binding protein [Acidimicrobiales bacterium]
MLELTSLTRRFGDVAALDGLSFSVPKGRVVGFLGPNGAGKTTAMRAVMGISIPDEGSVTWNGQPVDASVRQRFGYMPEERGLYPTMVVRDQLIYLGRLHGMSKTDAAVATDHWAEVLGVADRSTDKLEALSLGNQQRVQLAAALLYSPEVLVLDEPFSGLDPVGIDALATVLAEQAAAGVAVIFSSHQLDLVEDLCQEVAIIHQGRLVASGSVADLTRPDGRHVVVEVDADDSNWPNQIAGVDVVGSIGPRVRLRLGDGAEADQVLLAAQAAGHLRHFSLEHRTLSDVFRAAVGSQPATSAP